METKTTSRRLLLTVERVPIRRLENEQRTKNGARERAAKIARRGPVTRSRHISSGGEFKGGPGVAPGRPTPRSAVAGSSVWKW